MRGYHERANHEKVQMRKSSNSLIEADEYVQNVSQVIGNKINSDLFKVEDRNREILHFRMDIFALNDVESAESRRTSTRGRNTIDYRRVSIA